MEQTIYPYNKETMEAMDWILEQSIKVKSLVVSEERDEYAKQKTSQIKDPMTKSIKEDEFAKIFTEGWICLKNNKMLHPTNTRETVVMSTAEGRQIMKNGGFKADKKRFEEQLLLKEEDRELLRQLRNFQVKEHEEKLVNLENTLAKQAKEDKERSEFWTKSSEKAEIEIEEHKKRLANLDDVLAKQAIKDKEQSDYLIKSSELAELEIKEHQKRLANLEKKLEEQAIKDKKQDEFWTTSTEKNKEQMGLIQMNKKWLIFLFIVTAVNLIFAFSAWWKS